MVMAPLPEAGLQALLDWTAKIARYGGYTEMDFMGPKVGGWVGGWANKWEEEAGREAETDSMRCGALRRSKNHARGGPSLGLAPATLGILHALSDVLPTLVPSRTCPCRAPCRPSPPTKPALSTAERCTASNMAQNGKCW